MDRAALLIGLAGLCLAADTSPDLLLERLRHRVLAEVPRISNYTCEETITRRYFKPRKALAANSCETSPLLQSWSLDRLRLDVAVTPEREIFSWAGAVQFEDRDLTEITGGPIGSGVFAGFLSSIFGEGGAEFAYADETPAAMEFAYRVPPERSHYRVRAGSEWVVAGYAGRIVIDRNTGDLVRLSVRASGLPESTGSCRIETEIEYGGSLLPSTARQRFVLRTGMENENTAIFSACREYRGESKISFVPDDAARGGIPNTPPGHEPAGDRLPADLPVTMQLAAPLDTWSASAGDVIALRLRKPIVDSAKRVLVPAGAAIEARLLRVQRYFTKPERVRIVMRPEIIRHGDTRLRLSALPAKGLEAQFDFVGDHVIVPKGYHTGWRTAAGPLEINP
jgi:hypothetical protein